MCPMTAFEQPPVLTGTSERQLAALRSYLFRLSEALNVAMAGVGSAQAETRERINALTGSGGTGGAAGERAEEVSSLREVIIKTAELVRIAKDELEQSFRYQYSAVSQYFGSTTEEVERTVRETAQGVVDSYHYEAALDALSASFDSYKVSTQGFIRQGIIGYEEDGMTPIIGIAIGQELTAKAITIDGVEYEEIEKNTNLATYTAGKMSFWVNGVEAAWVSNSDFHMVNGVISGTLTLGNWLISQTNGLNIKWIGN